MDTTSPPLAAEVLSTLRAHQQALRQAGIRNGLEADDLRHDAVERCLERISEAVFRRGDRAAILLPKQPWIDIRGMGNRLRHAYDQIDTRIVWSVVSDDLPSLKADAVAALEGLADMHKPEPP